MKVIGSATSESSCSSVRPSRGVGRQPREHVVLGLALPHGERDADGGLLDRLVRGLAADAVADRGHQHLGGGQERQVAVELALDHGRVRAELVEHGEERLEQPVGGEERVGQRHPAYDRAGDVALVPLVAGELADHGEVAAEHDGEAVDPLAGPGVHLVRHRRRADLALLEALGDQLVAGHQPDRGGEVGRARRPAGPARRARRSRASAGTPGRRWSAPARSRGGRRPAARARPASRRRRRAGRACPGPCPSGP